MKTFINKIKQKILNKKETRKKQLLEDEKLSILEKIKKYHIILWLLIFFPIGFYKIFKYRLFPTWINIIIALFLSVFLICIVDSIIYPNRVINNKTETQLKENFSEDIGNIISLENYNIIEDYYIFDVISSEGRFDVYVNGSFEIVYITRTQPFLEIIYQNDNFKECYKGVFSEIIQFLNNKELNTFLSTNIEEIISTDMTTQTLKIDEVNYEFGLSFESVQTICNKNSDELVYERVKSSLKYNQKVYELVKKNFKQVGEIDYVPNITFNENYYTTYYATTDGNLFQIIVYDTGKISVNMRTN